MNNKEFDKHITQKFNKIKKIKKVAEQVTLLEFIEQYEKSYCELSLGSFWYSVNYPDVDYSNVSYGGTDPD
jgi:hypothetical protein